MTDSTWFSLKQALRRQLSADEFRTWFRPLQVHSEEPRRLVLLAPNDRFLHALEQSYRPVVDRAIAGFKGPKFEVLFAVADGQHDPASPQAAASSISAPPKRVTHSDAIALPAQEFNQRYTFDTFVVGSSNQFAVAAARAVAEAPGETYNPLFLYGGVGLGKTHLLHAAAQQLRAERPGFRVLYFTAEQFVNELINSIRFDRMPAFRERYRTIDALLIDDVQFLANKERTQEEFFHTFNALYTLQKQIILSSDSQPQDIPTLEERLRSRFGWGLIADIQPPDLETKIAILKRKAALEGIELPNSVALFIAQQVRSNIRELEGLLNRVQAFSALTGRPLDIELTQETLRDLLPGKARTLAASEILRVVAHHYGLRLPEIKSRNNSRQVAFPRQVAMYLCKRLTTLSYPEIGKQFNDKHHSTVMYAVEKIGSLRQQDADLDRVLDQFVRQLE
jgi:chromosomal replication initiator protein